MIIACRYGCRTLNAINLRYSPQISQINLKFLKLNINNPPKFPKS